MATSLVAPVTVRKFSGETSAESPDLLAVEEPLEIRLGFGPADDRQQRSVSVTMRTPGHDQELAMGFLFTEGIIQHPADIVSCRHCVQEADKDGNVIRVELHPDVRVDWARLERNTFTSSSCGLCGKATIEAVQALAPGPVTSDFALSVNILHSLPERVRDTQRAFAYTGGIHAAALFDATGKLLLVREDIGRHNALDKVIGAAFWNGWLPLSQHGIFLSGRIGVELVQKSWLAGVPLLAAVGAPSSLAVQMAQEAGMTLAGFVRNDRFNLYSEFFRVQSTQAVTA
ncbi:formate dehydrogenase accessory sulfurtransferase FdhD [Spirosoma sp. KUDC1026]|uniref:formate dehydrogenase accessory sulfurtransferase FdhD n=1 Tax=Spirosoma sp. KUDC1026 TaxID=2745947 RepID=UPI00159BB2D7|nr:formate dehydrogenase accessory sulfurtransferase FdhD [Spirosoma sp. KUDC1026]QKZ12470.1 formate dehydrogenase accessory sulfurtransferase FdhD [Spirosoma sp. KUDC1026]